MVIRTRGFTTSTGDDENLAFAYCTDESGYCLSVCRFLDDELVEVMVVDQINHKTREVAVELSRDCLWLRLSPAAAAKLDGITEYTVPLEITDKELRELDKALSVIFADGRRGEYIKRLYTAGGPNVTLDVRVYKRHVVEGDGSEQFTSWEQ